MDVRENGLGRVIGCELRCIPPRFLESCWGLKWCPKFHARGPSEFDIGVLTPDGKYNSLKIRARPLAMERGPQGSIANLEPSLRLPSTIHDADGQLGLRRREPPSSPSWRFSVPASPVCTAHERTQDQTDFTCPHATPADPSVPLIAPGRTEGTLPIPIPGSGTMQPLSEPYTSELSYALLPGHSSHSSQSCGTQNVGTPLQLHYLSSRIMPCCIAGFSCPAVWRSAGE
ncbi:hypothetical protein F4604DRAFT_12264 [Suillus subluteus]|nr:hypothetical protein F4604DRAFT_12264 [Suillus subluteus]